MNQSLDEMHQRLLNLVQHCWSSFWNKIQNVCNICFTVKIGHGNDKDKPKAGGFVSHSITVSQSHELSTEYNLNCISIIIKFVFTYLQNFMMTYSIPTSLSVRIWPFQGRGRVRFPGGEHFVGQAFLIFMSIFSCFFSYSEFKKVIQHDHTHDEPKTNTNRVS